MSGAAVWGPAATVGGAAGASWSAAEAATQTGLVHRAIRASTAGPRAAHRSCHGEAVYEDEPGIKIAGYPLTGIIRQVRRRADFSQRELAKWAHLSPAAIGAIESGRLTPSLRTLQRLLNAANCQLVVVDANGRLVVPLMVWDGVADLAGRRFPAHLDTILDPEPGEWWADGYGLVRPPETFRRNRAVRDWERRKSREDVREHGSLTAGPRRPPRSLYG